MTTAEQEPLRAFHADPAIKTKFLGRIEAHRAAERIIQNYGYWMGGKGCAVGCTLEMETYPHAAYPKELGLPMWLAHLEYHIFEHLPKSDAQQWPVEFLEAIPVGAEVPDSMCDEFQIWWHERQLSHVDSDKYPGVESAIRSVISLLKRAVSNDEPDSAAWSAAESAARSAAESAAWSAAESAAWSAARSAARSAAESAAWSAARSAAESAAGSAAWSAAWSAAESAAESAARSAARSEAQAKRDWVLTALSNL